MKAKKSTKTVLDAYNEQVKDAMKPTHNNIRVNKKRAADKPK
jgi:hypothetical protein